MKPNEKRLEEYTKKLDEFQELAERFDKEVDKLCSVFNSAYDSDLIESTEAILVSWIRQTFLDRDGCEDIVQDWRFIHEFGKKPMEFEFKEGDEVLKISATTNKELADAMVLIFDLT